MTCPPEHRHGVTLTCYTAHDCRCIECRKNHADYLRAGRKIIGGDVHVDATGARRRLRALATLGYSTTRIAEGCGVAPNVLHYVRKGTQLRTATSTAQRIAHYYRDTCMHPAPVNHLTRAMIARAERAGWAGPLDWDNPDTDTERTAA